MLFITSPSRLPEIAGSLVLKGPRAQIDRKLYKKHMQDVLFNYPNLDVRAGAVYDLVLNSSGDPGSSQPSQVEGLKLGMSARLSGIFSVIAVHSDCGEIISCSQVVLCTGTFLSGEIHMGPFFP